MSELSPRRHTLTGAFTDARDYWSPIWDQMLASDPDLFEAHLNFAALPRQDGVPEPQARGFIYIAIDAPRTHLHAAGTRTHMRNTLRRGASREGIVEVLELTSVLGVHGTMQGVPALPEEMEASGKS